MNVVLGWVKSNVYSVVFLALMIVAPIALGIVARNMNEGVREEVKARAAKLAELSRIEKTKVNLVNPARGNPPLSAEIAVNRQFLDRYRAVAGQIGEDAERVQAKALAFNRRDRGVHLEELFPEAPIHQRETLPFEMYRVLRAAYEQLLTDVRAGATPSLESMQEDLEAAQARFRTQILIKEGGEALTADEQVWLTEQMTKTRLSKYAEAAKQIGLYGTLGDLGVPDQADTPARAEGEGMVRMFEWQWRFWIKQDIVSALGEANKAAESVLEAPVKRLVSLEVRQPAVMSAGAGGDGGGSGFSSGLSGGKRSGRKSGGTPSAQSRAAGAKADPAREVPLDFNVSFTGRSTNPLYDVRYARLVIVVDSSRIPEVMDALTRQNFITITNTKVDAVDTFADIKDGYFYGSALVSMLTLELETVWLREWTLPFMPREVKQTLGIPIPEPTAG
ncbi:MAG: hypothetical protein ACYS0G_14890 [Planctomycetota bacterium]|jgi:hypothetical protein